MGQNRRGARGGAGEGLRKGEKTVALFPAKCYNSQLSFILNLKVERCYILHNENLRNVAIIAHVDHGKTAPQG